MRGFRTQVAALAFFVTVAHPVLPAATKPPAKKKPLAPLTKEQRAIHALNRLTFGPRPGDLDQVLALGVDKWIDQQLQPETIDDSALNALLGPLRTLNMKPKDLAPKPAIRPN